MSTKLAVAESEVSKEKLMQDFRVVVTDAEELLRATAGLAGEKVSAARERIQENLTAAKQRLLRLVGPGDEERDHAGDKDLDTVRENRDARGQDGLPLLSGARGARGSRARDGRVLCGPAEQRGGRRRMPSDPVNLVIWSLTVELSIQ